MPWPRAHQRSVDALDAVDPEVEDTHDGLLADGEAEARMAREDAAALQKDDEGEEECTTTEDWGHSKVYFTCKGIVGIC